MKTIFNDVLSFDVKLNSSFGKIITIEGIDGAGKTTVVDNLVKKLNDRGYKAIHFYTSSLYNKYWEVIKRGIGYGIIDNEMNQLFHNVAFLTYLNSIFISLLNEYDYVVSEWYIYGKMVLSELYLDNIDNIALKLLENEYKSGNIIVPDYSFFIDTTPEVARDRIELRNGEFESKEKLDMLKKAYSIWDYYVNKYSIFKIDGNLTSEEITNKVLKRVLKNEK